MSLKDELQKLVDDQLDKTGIYWHIALIRKGKTPEAIHIVTRAGPKTYLSKSFGDLVKFAKAKRVPIITTILRSIGNKAFFTRRGFKQYPDSEWGKMWVILPPRRKKKKPPLAAKNRNPKRKRVKRRFLKKAQFPPPFKKLTRKRAKKLIERFKLHKNPDPPACEVCGMTYKEMKTGLDFGAVQDMLFVESNDPQFWRQKGRSSVLGVWFEIKRSMWRDHLEMCDDQPAQELYLEDFEY